MTISAADDPYLRVVSEFDAATTPAPTGLSARLALLARVVREVALGVPPRTPEEGHSTSSAGIPPTSD
jgi:hypothetical protein